MFIKKWLQSRRDRRQKAHAELNQRVRERRELREAWRVYNDKVRNAYPEGYVFDYLGAQLCVIRNHRPPYTQDTGLGIVMVSGAAQLTCHYRDGAGVLREWVIEGPALHNLMGERPPKTQPLHAVIDTGI